MPEALVTSTLQRALLARRPAPGLIVYSDRSTTQAESLWSYFKTEELERQE